MGIEVKALTRSSAAQKCAPLKALEHVQLVDCDISEPSSLSGVFDGVQAAFLTCGNFQGQAAAEKSFIDAAVAAGCPYLVKLGTVRCYTSIDSAAEYARYHAEIESHLEKEAGAMKYTVLCPNWFFSNHLGDVFGTLPMGVIAYPLSGEAEAAPVDPRDVGELAAQMMMASDPSAYHGLKLDVSGPGKISMLQLATLYTAELGRSVQLVKPSVDEWIAAAIKAGFEPWLARAVSHNFERWEAGDLAFTSSAEVLALAPPKRTMEDWVKQWAPLSPPPAGA